MLTAVTVAPFWLTLAFQALATFWSPGKANTSVQPLIVDVPVSAMVTLAVKPPGH